MHENVQYDILELNYTRLTLGAENTSITWRYQQTNLPTLTLLRATYADRNYLESSAPKLYIPPASPLAYYTNTAACSLSIRLLAYDESGDACARDSAAKYYKLEETSYWFPIYCLHKVYFQHKFNMVLF